MGNLLQDIRHSLRILTKNPAFTAVALVTLAIGIGANTAIFSVVSAVLMNPLPYPDAERIVRVREERPAMRGMADMSIMTADTLENWRDETDTLDALAGYRPASFTLTGEGEPARLRGAAVSSDMFPLLETAPLTGRTFERGEERPGANRVVVLSHAGWQQRFSGDPDVVGRSVLLDDNPHTVVGVMPQGFYFPDREAELWTPLATTVPNLQPGQVMIIAFQGLARLKPSVSVEQALAEGQTVVQRIQEGRSGPMAQMAAPTLRLIPLQEEMVGEARPAILALAAAVGFVMLIAVANLANLLLARGAAREREMAVRAAIGAGRSRLVRQLLTESTLLGLAGGVVGVAVAYWVIRSLPALAPADIPRIDEVVLDGRVLGFALSLSVGTGLLFGLIPALQGARLNLVRTLNEGGALSGGGFRLLRANRTRSTLAVAEIALALVLLVGAGLLIRSFVTLTDVDPGYDPSNVLTTRLDLPPARYADADARRNLFAQLLERLEQAPDVEAVGLVSFLPLSSGEARIIVQIPGRPAPASFEDRPSARPQVVSAGYFQAMGMRLVDGRWLNRADETTGADVLMVNDSFARQYFDGDAVGERLNQGPGGAQEIIGVVGDVRHAGLDTEPTPEIYGSYAQAMNRLTQGGVTLAIRTEGDPLTAVPFLRSAVLELDPSLPLDDVMTMEARLATSVAQPRFYAILLGVFAALALILASVGIYGILSYGVSQRSTEIGVRMALGAHRRNILRLVLQQGAWMIGLGVALGLLGAYSVSGLLASLLFGVTATDPLTFAAVPAVLITVAVVACYIPARRATRVDPMVALRYE
ncbi:MAG: ABC transporter permease [Vicinamibacterales bacterium]|jgi:putative ABC transport system permease protein|nr:ABC transporter permease [Vicinamibacterales bacterium]